jgi:hypothetical protein
LKGTWAAATLFKRKLRRRLSVQIAGCTMAVMPWETNCIQIENQCGIAPGRRRHYAIGSAARDTIRAKGLAATTVDDLCRAADVTKGAFFHFGSKDALGIAAAEFCDESRRQRPAL